MYMTDSPEFSWEERRDAEVLAQARAIQNDPARLRKAQAVLERNAEESIAALKGTPVPPSPRGRRNPATIQRLDIKR